MRFAGKLSFALLVLFFACDGDTTQPIQPEPVLVTVTPTTLSVLVGETQKLVAVVQHATNTNVMWRSSAPGVASVNATGDVLGVAPGTATITAISLQDTTRRAAASVEVTLLPILVIGVTPATATLATGETVRLTAFPESAYVGGVIWRSSLPGVASVAPSGAFTAQVTAIGSGTAVITALASADTTRRAAAVMRVVVGPDTMPVLGLGAVPERYTAEVAVRGNVAYTSTWGNRGSPGNMVKIWHVAGNTPVLVDTVHVPGAGITGDVQISDDGAVLVVAIEGASTNNGIMIYSLSNPSRPDSLARFTSSTTRPGVHTVKLGRVNGRHYAFLSVDPSGTTTPARLVIVDITDPRNPFEVFSQAMGRPYVHDVFVRAGILFTALWHDGLRIFDIGGGGRGGSPASPVVLGQIPTVSGSIHNIWWFHDPTDGSKRYVFLGEEGPSAGLTTASGDIHVIDVTDLSNPVQVAQFNVPGAGTHNFWMDEASGILYAAYYNGGVRALDVRGDLGSCSATDRNSRGFCDLRLMGRERGVALPPAPFIWGVVHQGTHVYASDMKAGLYKIDASRLKR